MTQNEEQYRDVHFPAAGVDRSLAFDRQPNRPVGPNRQYRRTCYLGVNVRAYDPRTNRSRGGSRTGVVKYITTKVAGEVWVVQDLATISGFFDPPGGGDVQLSQSGRVVTLVAVSEGRVFSVNAGETAWVEATNNSGETPPLNFTGIMFSAPNQQKLWFVDGTNACVFTPADNTVAAWTASAGVFPASEDGSLPRLVENWRGRLVLSGLIEDSQNLFFSAVDGPTDFEYEPQSPTETAAFALNLPNGGFGLIGDSVAAMIPYTDDVLVIGCDSSIHIMRGDPRSGGRVDLVTRSIGMAFGRPWCMDSNGTIFFMSNRCGIYVMAPMDNRQPIRISQAIESLLQDIDTGANAVRLLWNDRAQALHVFITPTDAPAAATHFVWEQRTNAWFIDRFANNNHNPLCCCVFDGNEARDRVPLIGSWDGVVRSLSVDAVTDDGVPIASEVLIGPIVTKDMDDITLKDLHAVMGADSGDVSYEVLVGDSPEDALASTPVDSGTWEAGRNLNSYVQSSGHAVYVRVFTPSSRWAMESIKARVLANGRIRRRQQ